MEVAQLLPWLKVFSKFSSVQPGAKRQLFFNNLKSRPYPFPTSCTLSLLGKFPVKVLPGAKSQSLLPG